MTSQIPALKTRRLIFTQNEVALNYTRDIYVMRPVLFGALVRDFAEQLNDERGYRAAHLSLLVLNAFLQGRYAANVIFTSLIDVDPISQDDLRRGLQPGEYDLAFARTFDERTAERVNSLTADFVNNGYKGYSLLAQKDITTDKKGNEVHSFTAPAYAFDLNKNSKHDLLDLTDAQIGAAILYNFQSGLDVKQGRLQSNLYEKHLNKFLFDDDNTFDSELNIRVRNKDVRFAMSGIWNMHFGLKKSSERVNALGRRNQLSLYVKRQIEKDELGL